MLRRSNILRQAMGGGARGQYEQTARENAHMRSHVYHRDGSYNFKGIFMYLYDKSFYTFGTIFTVVFGLISYHYLVKYATQRYTDKNQGLFDQREEFLRSTGKLKSEKHLVKPLRQMEDMDAYNQTLAPTLIDEDTGEPKKMISLSFVEDDDPRSVVNDPRFQERKFH